MQWRVVAQRHRLDVGVDARKRRLLGDRSSGRPGSVSAMFCRMEEPKT
jgi:hypothetical protein